MLGRLASARISRVIAIAAIVVLLPLYALAALAVDIAGDNVNDEVRARARSISAVSAVQVESEMSSFGELVQSYAGRPGLQTAVSNGDSEAIDDHLSDLLQARPGISLAAFVKPDGRLLAVRPDTQSIVGADFSHRDWFKGVTAKKATYISEAFQAATPGNPMVVAAASPVWAPQSGPSGPELLGYIASGYSLGQMQHFTQDLAMSQGISLTITDQRGVKLAGSTGAVTEPVNLSGDERVRSALAGRSGVGTVESDRGTMLSAYIAVKGLGWTVIAELPAAETTDKIGLLRKTVYGIAALLSLIALFGLALLTALLRQRARIEDDLKTSENETRSILEATEDAFVSMDEAGSVTRWSPRAEDLFGWKSSEIVGNRLSETIIPPEFREAHEEGRKRFLQSGEGPVLNQRLELEALDKTGRRFPVELAVWAVCIRGHYTFNAFLHEISERRNAAEAMAKAQEEAMKASRLKSEFLANMSHEIRTPMNGVIGMGTLLLQTPLNPEQRDYAETIRRSADGLLTIINDILDFSKIEAGKLELETVDFNVRTVLEEAADLLSEAAHAKALELAILIQPNVPSTVAGDPGRLRQILLNLLSNAVKFTEQGEVVVACRVVDQVGDEALLRFEVTDTGQGISQPSQVHLFESFTQADASTTRRHGGTGLGLAISAQLVSLMRGEIGVNSEPGRGSTFWFTARFTRRADAPIAKRGDLVRMRRLRVLVVDDNATNRHILEQLVSSWMMTCKSVVSPSECLDELERGRQANEAYHVALLDYNMPEMNGIELSETIQARGGFDDLKLVLLTSSSGHEVRQGAKDSTFAAYLTKPIRQSSLYDCLALLAGARSEGSETELPLLTQGTITHAVGRNRAHLLVAEDNPVNQKVAVRTLEKLGYGADVAANGQEAVDAVASIPYAAVLMDCQMPEVDGFEATRRIRALPGSERNIPIIAMTAAAMADDEQQCRDAGMDDYISKPVSWNDLQRVLARWITVRPTCQTVDLSNKDDIVRAAGGVLDVGQLEQLLRLGEGSETARGHLQEMMTTFLDSTETRMVDLRSAVESQDLPSVAQVCHSLKGSFGAFGATRAMELCQQLEQGAKDNRAGSLAQLCSELNEEYSRVTSAVRALLTPGST